MIERERKGRRECASGSPYCGRVEHGELVVCSECEDRELEEAEERKRERAEEDEEASRTEFQEPEPDQIFRREPFQTDDAEGRDL